MSDKPFRPMLAGGFEATSLRFPVLASPKLDGIRCCAMGGAPMSRSMKVLPSRQLQVFFGKHAAAFEGLDGEIIVGDPTDHDVYRNTASHVMADDKVYRFTYYAFDRWNMPSTVYQEREAELMSLLDSGVYPQVVRLPNTLLSNHDDLEAYEADVLAQGYEGVMLRDPHSLYKQGRSSTREGILLKVKRYEDAEAVVIGTEEEMHNGNEAEKNELGRTKRSSAQAGLVGKGTMGALIVRGLNGAFKDVEFNVGTGFSAADRAAEWPVGTIVTYKFFNVGTKDKPRHPVFQGIRHAADMDAVA